MFFFEMAGDGPEPIDQHPSSDKVEPAAIGSHNGMRRLVRIPERASQEENRKGEAAMWSG
jgi:hypothetical protein